MAKEENFSLLKVTVAGSRSRPLCLQSENEKCDQEMVDDKTGQKNNKTSETKSSVKRCSVVTSLVLNSLTGMF